MIPDIIHSMARVKEISKVQILKFSNFLYLILASVFLISPAGFLKANGTPLPVAQIPAEVAVDSSVLIDRILTEIDFDKSFETALTGSSFLLKKIPQEKDANLQTKINTMTAQTKVKLEKLKPQRKLETKAQLKKLFLSKFSAEELKYLDVILKYSVLKKFNAFIASEEYGRIFAKPFIDDKAEVDQLRKKIDELKKVAAQPLKPSSTK